MAEGIAVEGMRLVQENLPRAYRDGADLEARANMLVAAAMGATAFQKGLGAIHALSHPVGALYGTHHGLTNAVFMPYVLDFNREMIRDKADRLAAWLGLEGGFSGLLDFILRLRRDIGIPIPSTGSESTTAASRKWPKWPSSIRRPAATRGCSASKTRWNFTAGHTRDGSAEAETIRFRAAGFSPAPLGIEPHHRSTDPQIQRETYE